MINFNIKIASFFKASLLALVLVLPHIMVGQTTKITRADYNRWEKYALPNTVYFSVYTGYGSYDLQELSLFQSGFDKELGFNLQQNSNFPPYLLFGGSISQKYDRTCYGLSFEYMSTGARSSLSDYSGLIYSDFVCKGYKFGVVIENKINYTFKFADKLSAGYKLEFGGFYSLIRNEIATKLYNTPNVSGSNSFSFSSNTLFVEPSLYASYQLAKNTAVQLNGGFMLDVPASVELYLNEYTSISKISWAGYRFRLALVQAF